MRRLFVVLLYLFVVILPLSCQSPCSLMVPQLFCGDSTLCDQYGITSHITWHGFEYDNYQKNVDLIKKCGNNIIRTDFSAANLGWGKERMDYSVWDNVFNTAISQGLQLLPIIYHNPLPQTKDNGESIRAYVESCVTRYGHNVAGWEVGNELDLQHVQDGSIPPFLYLSLLKDTYTAVKRTNKNNKVLIGAIGDLNNHYLDSLLALDAAKYFDIVDVHFYSAYDIPEKIIPFYQRLDSILIRYHVEKPVWLTETGYRSYRGEADQDVFYTEILPIAYKQIGLDVSKCSMGLLYDSRIQSSFRNQDNKNIYYGFSSCQLIKLDELKKLSVSQCPVLMILFREFFPTGYFEDLRSYVERGGTVVFPEGGAALFNELDLKTNEKKAVGKKYYEPLHISYMFPWDAEAKEKGVKKITSIHTASFVKVNYSWQDEDVSCPMYLMNTNLKSGDEMIPIVYGDDEQYTGVVAAIYCLNSNLKGNIIIQTRHNHSTYVSERTQASRIPRMYLLSYAMGVDKVLLYCLRNRHEDRGYGIVRTNDDGKPSFETLSTLSRFLPSGSSRPQIKTDQNQYIASWITPEGKKVYCVWSSWVGQNKKVKVRGRAQYYDENGVKIRKCDLNVSPEVTYITGATSVEFE